MKTLIYWHIDIWYIHISIYFHIIIFIYQYISKLTIKILSYWHIRILINIYCNILVTWHTDYVLIVMEFSRQYNLNVTFARGGIKKSLCRSNSLGTSHSTQGKNDSSSSSTAELHCTVLYSSIYRCAVRPYVAINISIRYGS